MEILFTATPGQSLASKALPNGASIVSIAIDNPSGSWLYVVSERIFVAPYTMGVIVNLSYTQTSISVNAQAGPTGQQSSTAGDNWQLTLYDYENTPNSGTPYVTKTDQPELSTIFFNVFATSSATPGNAVTTAILGGSTTKRIRISTIIARLPEVYGNPMAIKVASDDLNITIFYDRISHNRPVARIDFYPPFDMKVGKELYVEALLNDIWAIGDASSAQVWINGSIV